MVIVKRWLLVLMMVTLGSFSLMTTTNAATVAVREDFGKYFEGFTSGTFVVYDESKDQYSVFNEQQSETRLTPCSTFKIYNSLLLWKPEPHQTKTWCCPGTGNNGSFRFGTKITRWLPASRIPLSGIIRHLPRA